MRGGSRIFRKSYQRTEIEELVNQYKAQSNTLYSPVTNKVCSDFVRWRCSITYNLDRESSNYFFFLLEKPHFSEYSGKQLTDDDFSYSDTFRNWKGWKKYTVDERKDLIWKRLKRSPEAIENGRASLKEFYATDHGKDVRRAQNIKSMISLKKFWQTEEGKAVRKRSGLKQSATMKQKILDGTFTPNIRNSLTRWIADIDGKKFRSSWEAAFYENNRHLQFEKLRIPYDKGVYIADFIDEQNRILYEIKPIAMYKVQEAKIQQIIKYCLDNNWRFIWINEHTLKDYINLSRLENNYPFIYKQVRKGIKC